MPIKLVPPRPGSPYYYMRGEHLGVGVNETTHATRAALARRIIRKRERDIESGVFAEKNPLTFEEAVDAYLNAGGDDTYMPRLIAHFIGISAGEIDQAAIDNAAATLYPTASNATRNRSVYTPVSAVLRHVGKGFQMKRPKGAQGQVLTGWLPEDKAFAVLEQAFIMDPEFGIYLLLLLYTGCRLSEPLKATCEDLNLQAAELFVGRTKNGEPRRVFLPPQVVTALANHPRGLDRKDERLFRFHKGGRFYDKLREAARRAGVTFPPRQKFHLFRHTFATWMRRHAGADVDTLLATRAWKSRASAARYMHTVVNEEAQRAALLPAPKTKAV